MGKEVRKGKEKGKGRERKGKGKGGKGGNEEEGGRTARGGEGKGMDDPATYLAMLAALILFERLITNVVWDSGIMGDNLTSQEEGNRVCM